MISGPAMGGRLRLLAVAFLLAAPALAAQTPASASVQGTVMDSIHAKPANGAMVFLTRTSPEPSEFRSAITDDKGRFHFDSLSAGRYSMSYATAYLDSLGVGMPARELTLAEGQRARVDFATPSGATLRAAACPGLTLAKGQGAVVGQVTDADTDRPLTTAHVAVSWMDLAVDSSFHPVTTQRGGDVAVDSLGRYRLCGVPTETWLQLQVQDSGFAGSVITLSVGDAGGVVVRDLSLSDESARSLASLDSIAQVAAGDTTAAAPLLTGTATVTGSVRGPSGQPLPEAQVRIRDAAGVARTDSSGRFTLVNQPAGSQLLETRHIGYLLGQVPVELRSGRTTETAVSLTRIVNLDSVLVTARRARYPEFEQRRRSHFGRYLDEADIEKLHPFETSDLLRMIPGFRIQGSGLDARVMSTRGMISLSGNGGCPTNVVINGIQHQDINLLDPADIGAVEAYAGPSGAPLQYDSACGVIVLWMKR
ncbi:MAG TPA: TonB-dependent receptor [Gemmatimonadaceae bacterium]|nr:TonB-dependent receptor [Gemmatimonadaceae bacterium]